MLTAGDISVDFWRRNCYFHFAPIYCAKWSITSGPGNRKLQRQTEKEKHSSEWQAVSKQCKQTHCAGLGASRAISAIASSAFLFSLLLLPNATGCDASPPLCSRFSSTETHPHFSPLAQNAQELTLVSRTLKLTKPKRIASWKRNTGLHYIRCFVCWNYLKSTVLL